MIESLGYLVLGILVLFVPGFLLSFLLYADKDGLDFWERIGASIGLSALIDALIIAILAHPPLLALRFLPFLGSVVIFCGFCGAVLALRKKSLRAFKSFWIRTESEG
ncbi:hypothetical protein AKJ65_05445 [candidate division MSBL1 archaeon SCGC-AAA259E19]|uniref:Uncharacterized protein n=2 Tax=candidate division MSBL1 TaxID=215777 RepID=A0A133V1I5_9EURY|nr:hypothetical protein AKJ65_05445 [candidate division MSBL1 archaeon SCGC-AAA259E19]KXB00292.1 hypothetical protein AKJ41_04195 [candidate division MSBL1 archaeon SCGC-AAA259O05]